MLDSLTPVIQTLIVINIPLISVNIRTWLIDHLSLFDKMLIFEMTHIINQNYDLCTLNPSLKLRVIPTYVIEKYKNKKMVFGEKILNIIPIVCGGYFCFAILLIDGLFNAMRLDPEPLILSYTILLLGHWMIILNPKIHNIITISSRYLFLIFGVLIFLLGYNFNIIPSIGNFSLIPILFVLFTAMFSFLFTGYYIKKWVKEETVKLKDKVNTCSKLLELNKNKVDRSISDLAETLLSDKYLEEIIDDS